MHTLKQEITLEGMMMMYHVYPACPPPCYVPMPLYSGYHPYPSPYLFHSQPYNSPTPSSLPKLKDYGPNPLVININEATKQNRNYRTALWTGEHLQVTLMSINPGDDIGLEVHPTVDQFIRIEEGQGLVQMGNRKENLNYQQLVFDDSAIMVPAGKWHNVINTGHRPLKLYAIYAPPEHPRGTVHRTKAEAFQAHP